MSKTINIIEASTDSKVLFEGTMTKTMKVFTNKGDLVAIIGCRKALVSYSHPEGTFLVVQQENVIVPDTLKVVVPAFKLDEHQFQIIQSGSVKELL